MLDHVIAYHRNELKQLEHVRENENRMYQDHAVAAAPAEIAKHQAFLAALEQVRSELLGDYALHRHVKRGSVYQEIGPLMIQAARPIVDDETLTLYRDVDDGKWFARPPEEFQDGRFIPVERQVAAGSGLTYYDTSPITMLGSRQPREVPPDDGVVRIKLRSPADDDHLLTVTHARWSQIATQIITTSKFTLTEGDAPEDYWGTWAVLHAVSSLTGHSELHVDRLF